MRNKLLAWFNLAYRFNRHVLTRVPLRALRGGADFDRFVGAVAPEGYLPLTVQERATVPATMRCVHCGMCALVALAGPAPASAPPPEPARFSAWDEPWTFVAGPSRSLDRAALVDAGASPWNTDAAAALCPTGVPIALLAATHHRLARAGTPPAPAAPWPVTRPRRGLPLMPILLLALLLALLIPEPVMAQSAAPPAERPRAREAGVIVGVFDPGPLNAITDVAGVRVGQTTVREGTRVNTGVTAILPHDGNLFRERVPAAIVVANGFGKLIGITQVRELGELETPILLTCTLCVWRAADAMTEWLLRQPGMNDVRSINPVVGETNDGGLNDIRARPIAAADVTRALESAATGPVEEGAVGAGAGTVAFGWKGGIGTSSRRLPDENGGYTVGVLVQSNYGGILTINGAPVGRELGRFSFQRAATGDAAADRARAEPSPDGSIMIVVATDAPLDARNLERLATRAFTGLARTGSSMSNGSGDYAIAFSTAAAVRRESSRGPRAVEELPNDAMSTLFQAVAEATEEAIYNSLFKATTVQGHRTTVEALPVDRVLEILRRYGALGQDRSLPPARR